MFIFAVICIIVAVVARFTLPTRVVTRKFDAGVGNPGNKYEKSEIAVNPRAMAFTSLLVLGVLALLLSSVTIVGTRNVGVENFYGRPTGRNMGAGPNLKAPWNSVTDVDGTIHPENFSGEICIPVKIADGGEGCVDVAYRWRVKRDNADAAFQDYRKSDSDIDDAIRNALIVTNMPASVNEVFSDFDPLADVNVEITELTPEALAKLRINVNPDYELYSTKVLANLRKKLEDVGDLIEINSVTISYLRLPKTTQERINAFNKAIQDTRISVQQIATKTAQADGNNELAKSLQDPAVLVSKCLDSLAAGEFTPPAGFSCWPGSGSAVVIPSAKQEAAK